MAEMKKYLGGCHCGKVRYEVTTDLKQVVDCNCSHCSKKAFLLSFVPAEQFSLLKGQDSLSEYRFNKNIIRHLFCAECGVESFATGTTADGKQMYSVNVRCFDEIDLSTLNITHIDGKHR
jgi:hypothetical protein